MQCKEVAAVLEQEGLAPLSEYAHAHLLECHSCRNLFADLTEIAACAKTFPAETEPPAWIWTSLLTQLEEEGIIRPQLAPQVQESWTRRFTTSFATPFATLFHSRGLATACVGLLILVAAILQVQAPSQKISENHTMLADTGLTLTQDEQGLQNVSFSNQAAVDASYRDNLAILDKFITDCEQRVQQEPQDTLAREYLYGAYEQKAQLLSSMMDREGSGN